MFEAIIFIQQYILTLFLISTGTPAAIKALEVPICPPLAASCNAE